MEKTIKTKSRSNKAQISFMCQYMLEHKSFAAGEYRTPKGAAQMKRQWLQLKNALDDVGPHRSVEQWKICWRDLKRKARAEGGALNKAINATGNSSIIPAMSFNSSKILEVIGKEIAVGCGPAESPIGFSQMPTLSAPLPPLPEESSAPPLHLMEAVAPPPSPMEALAPPPRIMKAVSTPSQTLNETRPSRQKRIRVSHPPDRFLNAQNELNNLIKELIHEVRRSNVLREEHNHIL